MPATISSALTTMMSPPTGGSSLPVPPEMIKSLLSGQPAYTVNRERAAAVLDAGFRSYDFYTKVKPALFVGGLVGMGVSGLAIYKRRGRGTEIWVMWTAAFIASAATAWVARPIANAAPPGSSAAAQGTFGLLATIDKRRATLKAQDPNFADKVILRFENLPVVKAQLDSSPLIKAVL